jgi:ERCC4-type nuclease
MKKYDISIPKMMQIIIDTREQLPLFQNWKGLNIVKKSLSYGDYSIVGFENQISIERKTLADFVACCGNQRDRFLKEIQRYKENGCKFCGLVIEATFQDILYGHWLSNISVITVMSVINHLEIDFNFHFFYDSNRKNIEYWILTRFRRFYNNQRGENSFELSGGSSPPNPQEPKIRRVPGLTIKGFPPLRATDMRNKRVK